MLTRLRRWYLWGVDGRLRYQPAIRLLRQAAGSDSTILELGSGPHGLTLYWPRPVTGYDMDFTGPDLGWLRRVQAEPGTTRLPFDDRAFEFVFSMDMLEHVSGTDRPALIREMVRVSRTWVLLTCPCGQAALQYDRKLLELCRRCGVDQRWAAEHLQRGLPEQHEIEAALRSAPGEDRPFTIEIHGQLNVDTWYRLWRLTMTRFGPVRSLRNKLCWPLLPWLSRQNQEPTYRRVFILHKAKNTNSGNRGAPQT
jgi:hypothetical protein